MNLRERRNGENTMTDTIVSNECKKGNELDIELESIKSTALARIVEEVRNECKSDQTSPTAYNRTHNRHNR